MSNEKGTGCMFNACICTHVTCDFSNFTCLCIQSQECLCLKSSGCIAAGAESRGCGMVTEVRLVVNCISNVDWFCICMCIFHTSKWYYCSFLLATMLITLGRWVLQDRVHLLRLWSDFAHWNLQRSIPLSLFEASTGPSLPRRLPWRGAYNCRWERESLDSDCHFSLRLVRESAILQCTSLTFYASIPRVLVRLCSVRYQVRPVASFGSSTLLCRKLYSLMNYITHISCPFFYTLFSRIFSAARRSAGAARHLRPARFSRKWRMGFPARVTCSVKKEGRRFYCWRRKIRVVTWKDKPKYCRISNYDEGIIAEKIKM